MRQDRIRACRRPAGLGSCDSNSPAGRWSLVPTRPTLHPRSVGVRLENVEPGLPRVHGVHLALQNHSRLEESCRRQSLSSGENWTFSETPKHWWRSSWAEGRAGERGRPALGPRPRSRRSRDSLPQVTHPTPAANLSWNPRGAARGLQDPASARKRSAGRTALKAVGVRSAVLHRWWRGYCDGPYAGR